MIIIIPLKFTLNKKKQKYTDILRNLGYEVYLPQESTGLSAQIISNGGDKYEVSKNIFEEKIIECDGFFLLTASFDKIRKRNKTRNHILEGIWLEEETINSQRKILETFAENIIGKLSNNNVVTKTIDTTHISQQELLTYFLEFANSIVLEGSTRKVKVKK